MTVFQFKSEEISDLYWELFYAEGKRKCYDTENVTPSKGRKRGEAIADLYVENWTGRNISRATAEELCAGCDVYDQCKAYAMAAQEPIGIWGGTRPIDRGVKTKGVTL
jgi:hypothetical protein